MTPKNKNAQATNKAAQKATRDNLLSNCLIIFVLVILGFVLLVFLGKKETNQKVYWITTSIDPINKKIVDNSPNTTAQGYNGLAAVAETAYSLYSDSGLETFTATILNAMVHPQSKTVAVNAGTRKEQIANVLANKLDWSEDEKQEFIDYTQPQLGTNLEGYLYPDIYLFPDNATPIEVTREMVDNFYENIFYHYASSTSKIISVSNAVKIASLIEREAAGKRDMRLISGIIWNRIFKDMSLDIDATLQYAKGSETVGWWPRVVPEDKYLESPYNTYKYEGLPPTPISNPSLASIEAALNPQKTECLFYLHDKYGRIHCSVTYKEHVKNIKKYY
ncbi:MAG: endolytic transglycosylase MltG [Candidatus Paceibacterota bacterium]|jgi:UPF0755 protein